MSLLQLNERLKLSSHLKPKLTKRNVKRGRKKKKMLRRRMKTKVMNEPYSRLTKHYLINDFTCTALFFPISAHVFVCLFL